MMERSDRIYIAGHLGLIGSGFLRRFHQEGYQNLILRTRRELDLSDRSAVNAFFAENRPRVVVLAAGRVGGIVHNRDYPADFIRENLAIQLNVLQAAQEVGAEKLIFFGSSCMYPRECPQPMSEAALLSGKPEPTSIAYAIAKLAGVQMCLAYNQQYQHQVFLPVIPNSAYGPWDDFNPATSHVVSALIRKFHEAKEKGSAQVVLWGTGTPRREFVFVDDLVDACYWLLTQDLPDLTLPINIGVGQDWAIAELAEVIKTVVQYDGTIEWDTSKPDGTPRKLLDSSRLLATGWRPKTTLEAGIRQTYEWYLQNKLEVAVR